MFLGKLVSAIILCFAFIINAGLESERLVHVVGVATVVGVVEEYLSIFLVGMMTQRSLCMVSFSSLRGHCFFLDLVIISTLPELVTLAKLIGY